MSSLTQNSVDTSNVTEQFASVLNSLSGLKSYIRALEAQVKSVEKNVRKQMKQLERESKKNKNKGNRKASGFAVPTKISNDLCKFMGKPEGFQMARTEVTKYIINYITFGLCFNSRII